MSFTLSRLVENCLLFLTGGKRRQEPTKEEKRLELLDLVRKVREEQGDYDNPSPVTHKSRIRSKRRGKPGPVVLHARRAARKRVSDNLQRPDEPRS